MQRSFNDHRRTAFGASIIASLALTPVVASAQEEAGGGNFFVSFMSDGGPMMWVILGISMIGFVIFVERAFDMYVLKRLGAKTLTQKVVAAVEARQYRRALDLCGVRSSHPLLRTFRAGILRADRREKEIERAMEREMLAALPGLQTRLALMSLLANTATLLGLLGTIFGLIQAFNSIAVASAAERQDALASGISVAMYTTAFGISVAVPLLFFHHFLNRRSEIIVSEVEDGATALLVALSGEPAAPAELDQAAPQPDGPFRPAIA